MNTPDFEHPSGQGRRMYVMDVSPTIIHFNAAFKELFWKKLQAGMKPAAIFREAGIDPDTLGKTRVEGFKGMLKAEVKRGRGFRDLTTSNEFALHPHQLLLT